MSNSSRKAKKVSKTGKKPIRTTKTQIYREYEQGYKNGEMYLHLIEGKEGCEFIPHIEKSWTKAYKDGFVDGYNDVLESMRIEEYA